MDTTEHQQGQLIASPSGNAPFSTLCSPGLKRLLTEGEDGRSAVRLIAINKTMRAEAERLLPVIEQAKESAAPEELMAILVRHAPAFGVQAKSAGEWASLFGVYLDALDGLPAQALEDAFLRWNRGEIYGLGSGRHAFYPKPAELYKLADASKRELIMAAYRARRAFEYVEKEGVDWTPERKAAERQKAIDLGYLNPDGSVKWSAPKGVSDVVARPSVSPQEMAEQLRRRADTQARAGGAPISRHHCEAPDDVGDVI